MKKLLLLVVAILFCSGVEAQDNKMQKNMMHDTKMIQMKDYLKMKNGEIMVMKDGEMMIMHKEMMLSNGTVVFPNGMMKMKNGETMKMKNGDMMNMHGMRMEKREMKKEKK